MAVMDMFRNWHETLGIPVEIREDARFLCSTERFRPLGGWQEVIRMEYFYREMRREHAC